MFNIECMTELLQSLGTKVSITVETFVDPGVAWRRRNETPGTLDWVPVAVVGCRLVVARPSDLFTTRNDPHFQFAPCGFMGTLSIICGSYPTT
jgi:hypothetical protein